MSDKQVTFQETFGQYPFPEGVLTSFAAYPTRVKVNRQARTMTVELEGEQLAPNLVDQVQQSLARAFHLHQASVEFHAAQAEAQPAPVAVETPPAASQPAPGGDLYAQLEAMRRKVLNQSIPGGGHGKPKVKQLYGKINGKKKPVPLGELQLDMGSVLVEGTVFNVEHRELPKRKAWVICFDITDNTGSIRVNQFLEGEVANPIVKGIKKGQRVQVQGRLNVSRFENDMVLEPYGINEVPMPEGRKDTAEEKRIELHLHTKMSMMDALCDGKAIVKRAIEWGHPAIAITDHGVVQSFPDAYNASGRGEKIKVLYGVEAYYQNDVDERVSVHGPGDMPLDGEFIAFDLETTGLDPNTDAIIEIGAVRMRGAEVLEHYSTFADPGHPLSPKTVSLTSITDEMVRGAPKPAQAVADFLAWAGDTPLVAHNAEFDTGFVRAYCQRAGREFDPLYFDTLILTQYLCPQLNNHKLDTVSTHLGLPPFHHHRADDDAAICGQIFAAMIPMLKELGVERVSQINGALAGKKRGGRGRRSANHLILLAKNQTGLRNLYKLVSLSHLEHFNRFPIMPKSIINENREGLIVGSACEAGELFRAVVDGKDDRELERIASWYDYLEIQPLSNNAYMLRPDKEGRRIAQSLEDLRNFNRKIVELGHKLGKPVCATGDVHFTDPEEEIYRHILLAAKEFDDADSENPLYFRTTDEMLKEFAYLGAETAHEVVIESPALVASWCDNVRPLPDGLFTPKLENSEGELKDLVWGKAHALYGENPPQIVVDRINAELKDIIGCHYDVIYMSAQKLVQNSLEHGYLVGSRGSVGSSLVAFMSGITEVNSLPAHYRCPNCKHSDFDYAVEHGYGCGADMPDMKCPVCGADYAKDGFNIPFETFLGFGGDKVPDIDLNFSGEYQSSAHKYTFELFGSNHVFRAGTIGTVAEKTAIGYVRKYLERVGRYNVPFAEVLRLARGCMGVKRTTGQHPGGMVVIPQDKEIYDFCPVQHPADDKDSDIITTHFEYHSMESNLLKLDMLGHDDPSMIRMLQDITKVDPQKIPLDDPDTMSLFTTSEKLGFMDDPILGPTGAVAIPEFGTSFVRGMLEDTHPNQFDILVRLSGFSHGTDVWLGNAKDLITSGTAQVNEAIGCRDDIMIFLISKGFKDTRAFKIMESVRKGRGLPEGAEDEMKEHGVPQWYIDSCKKIAYLFPKAHAVAYVMMAFRIAWYKVHRPLAFYAAYFSIRAKAFDEKYMCRGIEVVKQKMKEIQAKKNAKDKADRPSAVEEDMLVTLEVCYEFYLRGLTFARMDISRSHAINFLVDEERNALIPPFTSVAGLGETVGWDIMEKRKGKTFISIEEFSLACTKVSNTHLQQLKEAGAFGDLPDSSQFSFF
ncbi:PolC-type DNA polymerase III [Pseudoflavonifractor sp. An187]|uniref:PolC-type DNA polymerase III n=1 Tax=Pseudoflavonifractor sp. An187 TaxID=1965578 RepID=UPI000B3A6CB7|nr:PolC-type DNA polymerase III [Pseudoflavonifractor sp. An187]OUP42590.1 PolC-type DNA polymerase III [Pseudoflavonifractor sp. An187]